MECLKTVTLSCIFSEFVGMLLHNVGHLVEILYLDLLIWTSSKSGHVLKRKQEETIIFIKVWPQLERNGRKVQMGIPR